MIGPFETLRKEAKAALIAKQPALYWWYRNLRRGWAEQEMALLPAFCRAGSVAVDVGANHGLFTHYLADRCAHVHAFEASPRMAELMRRGYERRGNVTVHELALSDKEGVATLQVPSFLGLSGYATLEQCDLASKVPVSCPMQQVQVPTRRLDEFELRNVSFIKVDVEGHEQEVLEGARETLKREATIVLAELEERHRKNAVSDVSALMASLGYRAYFLRKRQLSNIREFDLSRDQDAREPHGKRYVRNFVFVAPTRQVELAKQLGTLGYQLEA